MTLCQGLILSVILGLSMISQVHPSLMGLCNPTPIDIKHWHVPCQRLNCIGNSCTIFTLFRGTNKRW